MKIFPLLVLLASGGLNAANSAAQDKAAYATCAACHSIDGTAKPMGPTLQGIVGRKAASVSAYKGYTKAMRTSGITWTIAELDAFLKAPTKRVKGTMMTMSMPDDKKRAAVIRYLQTLK